MPKLTALKEVRYAGKTIHAGQSFDASEKDARVLTAIGKVSGAEPANKTDLPKVTTTKAAASAPEPEGEQADPLERSTKYQTRHMEADQAGLTGEAASQQSSRRGRRRKDQESTSSEDDAE
jgi:hypothetical protein